jgi:plasmid replication initiation protein
MGLNEQRLMILLTSMIEASDTEFKSCRIPVSEFVRLFDLDTHNMHEQIYIIISGLMKKQLTVWDGKSWEMLQWVSSATYKEGTGYVELRFDEMLKPYLLQLKDHFTQYDLATVVRFKSQYSIRLYELLKASAYLGRGGSFYRVFEIEELKRLFGVAKGEYKRVQDIRRRMIEPAVEEVSGFSDILITAVEYAKEGRAICSVKFTAEPKAGKSLVADEQARAAEPVAKEPAEHVAALMGFGIAEPTARKWAKQYGQRKVMEACGYVRAKCEAGQVKDIPAYLAKTLENDYHTAWLAENDKKKTVLAEAHARKSSEEAEENGRRQQTRQIIASALEAFHAMPDAEQERLRDQFEAENPSLMLKIWVKLRAKGEKPELSPVFSLLFVDFLGKSGKPLPV